MIGPPPVSQTARGVFGPLAAGTYTYEIYLQYEDEPPPLLELRSRQPLVVAASVPPVPTLVESTLILMLGLLAAVGVWTIGKAALR